MRFVRALLAVLVILSPLPALAGAKALTTLNLRTGPGTHYPVLDVLRRGEWVDVSVCKPGWCFVETDHASGWASAGYLAGLVDRRVVVVRRHRASQEWPAIWNEPLYPPRHLPVPYKHAVPYPDRTWY